MQQAVMSYNMYIIIYNGDLLPIAVMLLIPLPLQIATTSTCRPRPMKQVHPLLIPERASRILPTPRQNYLIRLTHIGETPYPRS